MSTPDITEGLPALFSAREKAASAGARGVRYDVTVGGVGFILCPSTQDPYLRQSADVQKQQFDTSQEPGEQTLDGLWVRSQTSWHHGAGVDYYEPGDRVNGATTEYRFTDSRGVDVWDEGNLTLLKKLVAEDDTSAASDCAVVGAYDPTDGDVWFSFFGSTLRRHTSAGSTDYAAASVDAQTGLVLAGTVLLAGGAFGVRSAPVSGGDFADLWHQLLGTAAYPYWVKSRIGITRGAALYFVTLAGGDLDAATAHWTHPDANWTWTGMAETPDAILASGHSGGQSAIFALTMTEDAGGTVPKLSQPFQVAEFPPGEQVTSIKSYLGRYLGIGTNKGIRAGVIGTGGQIQYGPLLVETADPVVSLAARDSYLYAATGANVIRVNLAESIGDGLRFPYAYDVEAGGTISNLSFHGDRILAGVPGTAAYLQSATDYVASGWLESGKIRYGTTAPKAFRLLDLAAQTGADTSVAASAVVGGADLSLYTVRNGGDGNGLSLATVPSPTGEIRYKVTLATSSAASTPTVEAVAIKAAPVPRRQRFVQYPLQLDDKGRDSKGTPYGWTGYASETLAALEELENSQSVVTVEDSTRPEQFEATIERIQMTRVKGRAGNGEGNFGGTLMLTVKTL